MPRDILTLQHRPRYEYLSIISISPFNLNRPQYVNKTNNTYFYFAYFVFTLKIALRITKELNEPLGKYIMFEIEIAGPWLLHSQELEKEC